MKLEQVEARQLMAADFHVVDDINRITNGFEDPSPVVQVGSIGYFTAHTAATGRELFKTNGTHSGTTLVKDVFPGPADSALTDLTNVGGVLYFAANDGTNGTELWRSNGTAAGTVMVKNIRAGIAGSGPEFLTNMNGILFFSASSEDGNILWKSDGTSDGTVIVKPYSSTSGANFPAHLINANGILYFSATNTNFGREVWKSDGTAAGTVIVADATPGTQGTQKRSSNPRQFTNVGSTVYFVAEPTVATPNEYRTELWRTTGTNSSTIQLTYSSQEDGIHSLIDVSGTLFFSGNGELIKSNGTIEGTVLVKNINDFGSGSVRNLANVGGILYFSAFYSVHVPPNSTDTKGSELWKSDGTAAGTVLVRDINPGQGSSFPGELTNVNGVLYFTALDETEDIGLWKSNGTSAGTIKIIGTPKGYAQHNLVNFAGTLFFSADDTNFYLDHLWKSDGTTAGTVPVRNVDSNDSNPSELTNVNDDLFFVANDGESGNELWSNNGFTTFRVADINSGTNSSNPHSLLNANGKLYFAASRALSGPELWTSDGTEAGTDQVADIRSGLAGSSPAELVNIGSAVYFTADNGTQGRELWRVSGRGATLVKDIRPGLASSGITGLTVVGTTLYFQANDGTNGPELWKSDGTSAGTVMVKNIRSGSIGSLPNNLTAVGSLLYFQATEGTNGRELWRSDGTSAGTFMVRNIHNRGVGIGSYPAQLTNVNGMLYFRASDGATGGELWKSNGTSAGTLRVKDIFAGTGSSYPSELTNVNGKLFFTAVDSLNDGELWTSDGTATGTVRVRNISATSSSFPISLTNVNGLLYFAADDSISGNELYKSDGTALGTTRIASFVPGFFGGNPINITTVGTRVFLSADSDYQGRELWVQDVLEATTRDDIFTVKVAESGTNVTVSYASSILQAPVVRGIFPISQELSIDGLTGNDVLRIEGTTGADLFDVSTSGIRTNGALLATSNFESRTLAGLAGNDTYRFTIEVQSLGAFRLDEAGGGVDTIDMSPINTSVNLNLNNSLQQSVNPKLALQLLSNSTFENAIGGQGNDVIIGNALSNTLRGNSGDDTLVSGLGDDVLMGEAGNDTLNGAVGNDTLQGGADDDRYLFDVNADPELDQLLELPGEGSDTLDFGLHSTPITLHLGLTTVQAVHVNRTIQLSAIDTFENAIGGSAADALTGSAVGNALTGGGGNDDLRGGLGDDTYVFGSPIFSEADQITELAGAGLDTISFATLSIPVTLNLATTAVQNVHTNRTLRLSSAVTFENAVGGSENDILAGNGLANVLVGNGGSDQLTGLGKRDMLIGGLGADTLSGGDDEDILIAGTTLHDQVFGNLNSLLSTWTSAATQVDRIIALRSGVGSPPVALVKEVDVLDDGGSLDSLTGAGSLDWFFRSIDDLVTDLNGEVIDEI